MTGAFHGRTGPPGRGQASTRERALEFLRQGGDSFVTTTVDAVFNWGRKYSMFLYPFVTACCGMEFMSVAGPRYDLDRFGCALPRFSPRQSDLLMVVGTITHRQAPILKKVYDQMAEPKWVMAFGACTCSGGPYNNYATLQGIDTIIPVDIYIPGCPPRPEAVLDGADEAPGADPAGAGARGRAPQGDRRVRSSRDREARRLSGRPAPEDVSMLPPRALFRPSAGAAPRLISYSAGHAGQRRSRSSATRSSGFVERLYVPMIVKGLVVTSRHFFSQPARLRHGQEPHGLRGAVSRGARRLPGCLPRHAGAGAARRTASPAAWPAACASSPVPTDCISIVPGELEGANIERYPEVFEIDTGALHVLRPLRGGLPGGGDRDEPGGRDRATTTAGR